MTTPFQEATTKKSKHFFFVYSLQILVKTFTISVTTAAACTCVERERSLKAAIVLASLGVKHTIISSDLL